MADLESFRGGIAPYLCLLGANPPQCMLGVVRNLPDVWPWIYYRHLRNPWSQKKPTLYYSYHICLNSHPRTCVAVCRLPIIQILQWLSCCYLVLPSCCIEMPRLCEMVRTDVYCACYWVALTPRSRRMILSRDDEVNERWCEWTDDQTVQGLRHNVSGLKNACNRCTFSDDFM